MRNLDWKDATSYRQGERGKIQPTMWKLSLGGKVSPIHITVTCGHTDFPNVWIMFCPEVGIYKEPLKGSYTAEHAQESAVIMVKQKLTHLQHTLDKALLEEEEKS